VSKKQIAIIIFILALTTRLFYALVFTHAPLSTDSKDYDILALQISQGKGYVNLSNEPTAFRAPVYPLFLGAIYSIAGHDLLWVRLIQALLGGAICVLVYLISTIIFDNITASLSGYLCSFHLPFIINSSQILTETLFTFLLLLSIFLILSSNGYRTLTISGLLFGLTLLTRPFLIFFFPFLFYWLYLKNKYDTFKSITILLISILLIVLPWTIRNYYRLNSFVPLANTGGIALYNSYVVPKKGFGYNSLEGIEDEYYSIKDETSKNKYLISKTVEYIKKNPVTVIKLTFIKLLLFIYPFDGYWYPISFGSKYNIFWGTILWFCSLGIIINLKKNDINMKLIYFLFLSFLIGVMIFHGSPRYRLPLEPLLICFAASGFTFLCKRNIRYVLMIIAVNISFFMIFRYFKLQHLFRILRNIG
jgi:4-amino-4-deoxy-L-arabinose transferase-like glycosyltransferase